MLVQCSTCLRTVWEGTNCNHGGSKVKVRPSVDTKPTGPEPLNTDGTINKKTIPVVVQRMFKQIGYDYPVTDFGKELKRDQS